MTITRRPATGWLILAVLLVAGPSQADPTGDCLRVKGWDVLPGTPRLCAYLADPDMMAACEQRGYRLGERVSDEAAASVLQYVLLCRDEYVIELRQGPETSTSTGSLSVVTALLEISGELRGEYTGGRILQMNRQGSGWRERAVEHWANYQDAGPDQ